MKKILLILLGILLPFTVLSQTTSIPDTNFEQSLIDLGIDTNGLNGNILISDAEVVTVLNLTNTLFDPTFGNPGITTVTGKIADLTGIETFINLTYLSSGYSDLTTVDLSNNVLLDELFLNDNLLTSINVSANTLLTRFGVMQNPINTIDVSTNTLLEELFLYDTGISTIDVSVNLNLWKLYIYDNPSIINLDFSNNSALSHLRIQNNTSLNSLDIRNGNNVNFNGLYTNNTPLLTCINTDAVVSEYMITYRGDKIFSTDCSNTTTIAIPDANFEQSLIDLGFDTNGLNGNILETNAQAITELYIDDPVNNENLPNVNVAISDLTGLEGFTNLSILHCRNNQLLGLDITNNAALTVLECESNQLTELDVTQNPLLITLGFGPNNLTEIDVSQNLALEGFWSNGNNLSTLNLEANSNLNVCGISDNPLTSVSLKNGNNQNMVYFVADNTPSLTCINADATVSQVMVDSGKVFSTDCSNTTTIAIPDTNFEQSLIDLGIDTNGLNGNILETNAQAVTGTLNVNSKNITDLSGIEAFTNITGLQAGDNQLPTIDVTNNTALEILWLESNLLTSVDVSQNTSLLNLAVGLNPITSLDVTGLTIITNLTTEVTLISALDLSNNINLEQLWIADNPNLTHLDLSHNPLLWNLGIYNTPIESLDLSDKPITKLWAQDMPNLYRLDLNNGNNTNVFEIFLTNNPSLECISVDDVTYATTNWTDVDPGATFSTDCGDVWTVYTPDSNLDTAMASYVTTVDGDGDGEISYEEATAFTGPLDLSGQGITDVTGLEAYINVPEINLANNNITDISSLLNGNVVTLTRQNLEFKNISRREFTGLSTLNVANNSIVEIDLSNITTLTTLDCSNNQLMLLNLKNGSNESITTFSALNNLDLICIQVDNVNYSDANWANIDVQTSFNEDCQYDLVLGSDDEALKNGLKLFPNPAINSVTIGSKITLLKIEIYSIQGKRIKSIHSNLNEISVEDLSSGVYFLRIFSENSFIMKKLIKQ